MLFTAESKQGNSRKKLQSKRIKKKFKEVENKEEQKEVKPEKLILISIVKKGIILAVFSACQFAHV